MSSPLSPEKALIFRIVHRDNVGWILDHGLHCRNGAVRDPHFHGIGNRDLIDRRASHVVSLPPGGTLADYVPFYFTPYSIMLLNIKTGYGGVPKIPNDQIVILVSSLRRVSELGIPFLFTNQHAYSAMAEYFSEIDQLGSIDWTLLRNRDFKKDPDDPGKQLRYQAEALIWRHLPVDGLLGICCNTAATEGMVQTALQERNLKTQTIVRPGWYF